MQKVSVIVITYNEERNIGRCLASVQWCDEIVVVDAFSTDGTAEMSKRMNARVIQKTWGGFAAQKQFALSCATNNWVLLVDADEEVTEELQKELRAIASSGSALSGFEVARKSYFLGRWMRFGGWYPGYQLRFFKRESAVISQRPVHEGVEVRGPVGRLLNPLNHFTYHSLAHYLGKMNDYTSLDVMNKIAESPGTIIRWYNFIINPAAVFVRMYFALGGFRDGFRGFLLAVYSSLYKLLLYAKTWEYQAASGSGHDLPPVTAESLSTIKGLE